MNSPLCSSETCGICARGIPSPGPKCRCPAIVHFPETSIGPVSPATALNSFSNSPGGTTFAENKGPVSLTLSPPPCMVFLEMKSANLPEKFPPGTEFWKLDSGRMLADFPDGAMMRPDGSVLDGMTAAGVSRSLLGDAELISEEEFRNAVPTPE